MFSAANVHMKQTSTNATFIFGGVVGSTGLNTNYINRFTSTGCSTDGIYFATGVSGMASTDISSKAYMFGGYKGNNQTAAIMKYTGTALSTESATMGTTVDNACAATLNNIAFIFGGHYVDLLAAIQRFDGSSRTTDSATLVVKRFQACCALNSSLGVIFHFGGSTYNKQVERYNGTTRTTDSATLSHQLSLSSSGFIGANNYIMGGYDDYNSAASNVIQKYTGTTMSTESAVLGYTSQDHSGSSMNSKCFKFGGKNASYYWQQIESFDGTTRITENGSLVAQLTQTAACPINNIRNYT